MWDALRTISLPAELDSLGNDPQQPSFLERLGGESVAERQAECAICFEPLCAAPVAVLVAKGGRRSCPHFLHKICADECPQQMGCPLCREKYDETLEVPPLSSPVEWFEIMDFNRNGGLEQKEAARAVAATLPVDVDVLEQVLPELWLAWGKSPEESLSFKELLGVEGLLWQLQESSNQSGPRTLHISTQNEATAEFETNKFGWFTHWDADRSGALDREEVVRGLTKQFHSDVSREVCKKKLRMRTVLEELWPAVDLDDNGKITLYEFCKDDGLADLILKQFSVKHSKSPTGSKSPRGTKSPTGTKSPRGRGPSSPRVQRSTLAQRRRKTLPAGQPVAGSPPMMAEALPFDRFVTEPAPVSPTCIGSGRVTRQPARRATYPGPEAQMDVQLPIRRHDTTGWTTAHDAGEDDRPMLLHRQALGFSPKAQRGAGRETTAQWAGALQEDDLAAWADPSRKKQDLGAPEARSPSQRRVSKNQPTQPEPGLRRSSKRRPSLQERRGRSPTEVTSPGRRVRSASSAVPRSPSSGLAPRIVAQSIWDTAPT